MDNYKKILQSRKLRIKASYEDITIKYIPCNSAYAGQYQPNTYNREKELYNLPNSYVDISTPNEKPSASTAILGIAVLGEAVLGGAK